MKRIIRLFLVMGLWGGFMDSSLVADDEISDSRRNAIVRAAERVGPAVVSISVIQVKVYRSNPFGFRDPLLERFFPELHREYRQRIKGMGSGFIIDGGGFVLTNQHVVEGAAEIAVNLPDGRQFEGELVGSDPTTDLAVIKIAGEALPSVTLGTTDDLIIGEWAIAIGNPFGYLLGDSKPTVTVGVISATDRDFEPQRGRIYRNMIQTDAAINPGNSGGPLVNSLGEVIGINTFIFTESGGSLGIGFAIPIDVAKRVMEELIAYGEVRQIWTGIHIQNIDLLIAQSLDLPYSGGVIISHIERGSPGQEAGLSVGDVILEVNGKKVAKETDMIEEFYTAQVGDEFELTVWRKGRLVKKQLIVREYSRG